MAFTETCSEWNHYRMQKSGRTARRVRKSGDYTLTGDGFFIGALEFKSENAAMDWMDDHAWELMSTYELVALHVFDSSASRFTTVAAWITDGEEAFEEISPSEYDSRYPPIN